MNLLAPFEEYDRRDRRRRRAKLARILCHFLMFEAFVLAGGGGVLAFLLWEQNAALLIGAGASWIIAAAFWCLTWGD